MGNKIAVRGIALYKNQLLCVKLKPYTENLKKDHSFWCLPGGGLETGETLLEAITREMIEETGVKPIVGNLLYVHQFRHGPKEYLEFFFHVTNSRDYLSIDLAKTTHGLKEIEEVDFVDPTKFKVLPKFLATEPLNAHVLNNEPTKIMSYL
jgi:ADP-ribose pyrophosphatase YjhB (NUDIX family)